MLRYLDSRKRKAEDDEGAGEGPSAPRPDPIHPERVSGNNTTGTAYILGRIRTT